MQENRRIHHDLEIATHEAEAARERFKTTDFAALAAEDHRTALKELEAQSESTQAQAADMLRQHEVEMKEVADRIIADDERSRVAKEKSAGLHAHIEQQKGLLEERKALLEALKSDS